MIGFIFFEIISSAKQIQEKRRKCLKARKIPKKIPKIPEKCPEIDWNMNSPNQVFGAHEKDFRAF
jgi:hypothetical protein